MKQVKPNVGKNRMEDLCCKLQKKIVLKKTNYKKSNFADLS